MALRQTKNIGYQQVGTPQVAGDIKAARFVADLSGGLLAADVLEFGVLPGGCEILRAVMTSANIAATATIDIGLLSGNAGAVSDARVMPATAEIFNDAVKNQANDAHAAALAPIGKANGDRGIGLKLSANEAAGANKSVTLWVYYTMY